MLTKGTEFSAGIDQLERLAPAVVALDGAGSRS
jgi:hypothetical protein